MCCMKKTFKKGTLRTRIKGKCVAIIPKNWKDKPKDKIKKTLEFGVIYVKEVFVFIYKEWSLTLSQWSSSGNPVAIQCAWNLDPSVHWNATGEMPVCFQWSSSGFPVVFQCVPIMQINTGSPLGHHWVLASTSVVPVASQCTCGSSGLPVCSNYAN